MISTALPSSRSAILDKNRSALAARLEPLGSTIVFERRVAHTAAALLPALQEARADGCTLILMFGASAITDRRDVIPAALEAAGGRVIQFGMPVDPGNLLLVGDLNGTPAVGLPGCARSPKLNGVDFVLWRLLAGLPVTRQEITAMGVGGLLSEIPSRPQPREESPTMLQQPRIEAVVLAAGRSTRMGANKLLETVGGMPLIRRSAEMALASHAHGVTVVTGHQAEALRAALAGLDVRFVHNPDYAQGLSTSLKTGIASLADDADGALVLLADMPDVDTTLLDRLIAAFSPDDGRAICMATRNGKRGNPVLWARRFFPEIMAVEGDVGARGLIGAYSELLCEVEAGTDAPFTDLDTPEALAAWRTRHE